MSRQTNFAQLGTAIVSVREDGADQSVGSGQSSLGGRGKRLRWRAGSLVLGVLTVSLVVPASPLRAATTQPNIVLILVDDMRWDELGSYLPNIQTQLVSQGVTFSNAFVAESLCCPSRASMLTGRYPSSTGVWGNTGPYGGAGAFKHNAGSTIATWLHGAGYNTALIGKYLNEYGGNQVSYIPPGWDTWDSFLGAPGYYNYTMDEQGTAVQFGSDDASYSTDVLSGLATSYIQKVPSSQPLFLWFAPTAPHAPFTPPARYTNALPNFKGIRPPNLNEADVSDKPAWVQARPLSTGTWDAKRKLQEQTLLAVDDAVGSITNALSATGRLSNTLIMFASDNGLSGMSHRWAEKEAPYEESIRIPIVLRYDPITAPLAGTSESRLAVNVDVAPTFADAAGVPAPGAQGMSLLSLLSAGGGAWRTEFPLEHLQVLSSTSPTPVPSFCGVRTTQYKYVEYVTGEREFYDLAADPYELQNQVNNPTYASEIATLHTDMLNLCSPPPPDWIQVTTMSPTSGSPGTSVTVTGLHFTGASNVTFHGMPAHFVVGSDTQLTATVPESASSGPICVIVGSRTGCNATTFTVNQASGVARMSQVGIAVNQSGATLNQLSVPVGPGGSPAGHTVVVAVAASNAITITSVTDSRGNA